MGGAAAGPDVFRAIADPTRRAILSLLRESSRTVRDLQRPFQITQPAISQHLRVLHEAGLVKARRVGREHHYHLNAKPLERVYEWASQFVDVRDPSGHVWRVSARRPPRAFPGSRQP